MFIWDELDTACDGYGIYKVRLRYPFAEVRSVLMTPIGTVSIAPARSSGSPALQGFPLLMHNEKS